MTKLEVTVRPVETRMYVVEGDGHEAAMAAARAECPEGWQILSALTVK